MDKSYYYQIPKWLKILALIILATVILFSAAIIWTHWTRNIEIVKAFISVLTISIPALIALLIIIFAEKFLSHSEIKKKTSFFLLKVLPKEFKIADVREAPFIRWSSSISINELPTIESMTNVEVAVSHVRGSNLALYCVDSYGVKILCRVQLNQKEYSVTFRIPCESQNHYEDLKNSLEGHLKVVILRGWTLDWRYSDDMIYGKPGLGVIFIQQSQSEFLFFDADLLRWAQEIAWLVNAVAYWCSKNGLSLEVKPQTQPNNLGAAD